jgi:hypothetical protein
MGAARPDQGLARYNSSLDIRSSGNATVVSRADNRVTGSARVNECVASTEPRFNFLLVYDSRNQQQQGMPGGFVHFREFRGANAD